jgi:hypothetical protein
MQTNLFGELRQPLVQAHGLGVDSMGVTVELVNIYEATLDPAFRPDLILFANVGGEKRETYAYLPIANEYLQDHRFPPITVVSYIPQNFKNWPPYYSLEQNCLTNGTLPSISFSYQFKSCSQKWKAAPQHKYLKAWGPALEYWKAGGKVRKIIGYDDGTADQKRCQTFAVNNSDVEDELYEYWYPLQQWHWNRERCKQAIRSAGLPIPPKSSCYFCAAMQPHEVAELEPDYLRGIVRLEARAKPRFKTAAMKGLWGRDTKASKDRPATITKKGKQLPFRPGRPARPGSMTQFIRELGLLPAEEIDRIISETPKEIIEYQSAFQRGEPVEPFGAFIQNQLIQIQGGAKEDVR